MNYVIANISGNHFSNTSDAWKNCNFPALFIFQKRFPDAVSRALLKVGFSLHSMHLVTNISINMQTNFIKNRNN